MSWHPASNGAGKRHWFVTAGVGRDHEDGRGRLIRYASLATAQAAADRLNKPSCGEDGCWTFPHNHPSEV